MGHLLPYEWKGLYSINSIRTYVISQTHDMIGYVAAKSGEFSSDIPHKFKSYFQ